MLTPKQQGVFRPLVDAAWSKTCSREPQLDQGDKRAREKWYRAELMKAIGAYTTKDEAAFREFARLCAHFEQIVGRSAYWTLRAEQAEDVRRVRFWIDQALIRVGGDWRYAQGIIDQMNFPGQDLDDLNLGQLHKVFQALDTHLRRHQAQAERDWKDQVRELTHGAPAHPHRRAA